MSYDSYLGPVYSTDTGMDTSALMDQLLRDLVAEYEANPHTDRSREYQRGRADMLITVAMIAYGTDRDTAVGRIGHAVLRYQASKEK